MLCFTCYLRFTCQGLAGVNKDLARLPESVPGLLARQGQPAISWHMELAALGKMQFCRKALRDAARRGAEATLGPFRKHSKTKRGSTNGACFSSGPRDELNRRPTRSRSESGASPRLKQMSIHGQLDRRPDHEVDFDELLCYLASCLQGIGCHLLLVAGGLLSYVFYVFYS